MSEHLYVGNDNDLVINGLKDESTGQYINDANIVCNVVVTAGGATVAGGVNVSVPYVATTNGNYMGVLPASAATVHDTTYDLNFTDPVKGLAITKRMQAQLRVT